MSTTEARRQEEGGNWISSHQRASSINSSQTPYLRSFLPGSHCPCPQSSFCGGPSCASLSILALCILLLWGTVEFVWVTASPFRASQHQKSVWKSLKANIPHLNLQYRIPSHYQKKSEMEFHNHFTLMNSILIKYSQ